MSKFNYCPLVWMFTNAVYLKKIENLQKEHGEFCTITTRYHMKNC